MQAEKNNFIFFMTTLAFFIISCSDSKKDKEATDKEVIPEVATTTSSSVDKLADSAKQTVIQKCFGNDGLKYSTVITINYMADNHVTGKVMTIELDSDKKEVAKFTGSVNGDKLTVKFAGAPPVVGTASEWTSKPWTIGNKSGKEGLGIVFNAKNYKTNKWAETNYEFVLTDCK